MNINNPTHNENNTWPRPAMTCGPDLPDPHRTTQISLPIWSLQVNGRTLDFVVNKGAGHSVAAKSWKSQFPLFSGKTMVSRDSGGSTTERFTVPLMVHATNTDSAISLKHVFLFSPVFPVNLLGRDLMCKLG